MKCHSNGSCNCSSNDSSSNSQPFSPATFAALTSENKKIDLISCEESTSLPFDTVVFSSEAIQTKACCPKIFITQPGLYQVSYLLNVKFKHGKSGEPHMPRPSITSFILLENSNKIACKTSAHTHHDDDFVTLSAIDCFSVSCREHPTTLSLAVSSDNGMNDLIFNYTITVNRVCTENSVTDFNSSSRDRNGCRNRSRDRDDCRDRSRDCDDCRDRSRRCDCF